jgi:hypothetical protein
MPQPVLGSCWMRSVWGALSLPGEIDGHDLEREVERSTQT